MKKILIALLFLIVTLTGLVSKMSAQEIIDIPPHTSGIFTQEDLWLFNINNLSNSNEDVSLRVIIVMEKEIPLVEITIPLFSMPPGLTNCSQLRAQSIINYFPNDNSQAFMKDNFIHYSSLSFCVSVYKSSENIFNNRFCKEFEAATIRAIQLVVPFNNDSIEVLNPLLQWEGINIPFGIPYRVRVTEIYYGQDPLVAIEMNPPNLEFQSEQNLLIYPPDAQPLKYNNRYAWQVMAIDKSKIMATSEVWVFTIADRQTTEKNNECYRTITKEINNDNYLYASTIKFAFENRTNSKWLKYQIIDLNSNKRLSGMPEVEIDYGLNKISIELSKIKDLKKGQMYMMVVNESGSNSQKLVFKSPLQ